MIRSELQTVLDDIKLFEGHVENSRKEVEYYESVVDLLKEEKLKVERDIIAEAERISLETVIGKLPQEKYIGKVLIGEDEAYALLSALLAWKHKTNNYAVMVLEEREDCLVVGFGEDEYVTLSKTTW